MKLNFFQKLSIIRKVEKAAKELKEISKKNEQLSADVQQAISNLNTDIDVLIGLLPSCRGVLGDIKKLVNDILVD